MSTSSSSSTGIRLNEKDKRTPFVYRSLLTLRYSLAVTTIVLARCLPWRSDHIDLSNSYNGTTRPCFQQLGLFYNQSEWLIKDKLSTELSGLSQPQLLRLSLLAPPCICSFHA
jgi:hypothetical protein